MKTVHVKPDARVTLRASGDGFLERYESAVGDLPVLHVCGDAEAMGRQYGALVGDMVRRNIDRMVGLFTALGVPAELVRLLLDKSWQRLEPHTPERFLIEMEAVAAGARDAGFDLSLADLQRLITVTNFDLYKREERALEILGEDAAPLLRKLQEQASMSCTMFAVWGSRTDGGRMWAHRNLDWVSQTGMHEDRLVTAYAPSDDRNGFVTMGYAGVLGALAGMNDRGIAFSEIGAFSTREELDGIPWVFLARRVLEEAATFERAVEMVQTAKHTIGYNYQVAFGDPQRHGMPGYAPNAAVFETNFECCEMFHADDPKERAACWTAPDGRSVHYGLPLKEAVMRGDMAFGERTRALQAADNGPGDPANDGDPLRGSTYLECHKPMHDMICAYAEGSEYVYPLRGAKVIESASPRPIGLEEALNIAATVAHNTEKLDESDWNVMSVVYAPTDLAFWVAYESCDAAGNWRNAPDSGYMEFALREVLVGRA